MQPNVRPQPGAGARKRLDVPALLVAALLLVNAAQGVDADGAPMAGDAPADVVSTPAELAAALSNGTTGVIQVMAGMRLPPGKWRPFGPGRWPGRGRGAACGGRAPPPQARACA